MSARAIYQGFKLTRGASSAICNRMRTGEFETRCDCKGILESLEEIEDPTPPSPKRRGREIVFNPLRFGEGGSRGEAGGVLNPFPHRLRKSSAMPFKSQEMRHRNRAIAKGSLHRLHRDDLDAVTTALKRTPVMRGAMRLSRWGKSLRCPGAATPALAEPPILVTGTRLFPRSRGPGASNANHRIANATASPRDDAGRIRLGIPFRRRSPS